MSFVGRFFLVVLVTGFAELYLLIGASRSIGFLATVGLCMLTGMVGGSLVRHQGLQTLQEINAAAARGQVPAREIVSGVVLLIVGVLLITPGFITDVLGFLMLVPQIRLAAASLMADRMQKRAEIFPGGFDPTAPRPGRRGRIIDIEPEGSEGTAKKQKRGTDRQS